MADAFWEEYSKDRDDDLLSRCYRAMYLAAPQPTEQQPVGEMISNDGDIYWTDCHPPMGTKLYATYRKEQEK